MKNVEKESPKALSEVDVETANHFITVDTSIRLATVNCLAALKPCNLIN